MKNLLFIFFIFDLTGCTALAPVSSITPKNATAGKSCNFLTGNGQYDRNKYQLFGSNNVLNYKKGGLNLTLCGDVYYSYGYMAGPLLPIIPIPFFVSDYQDGAAYMALINDSSKNSVFLSSSFAKDQNGRILDLCKERPAPDRTRAECEPYPVVDKNKIELPVGGYLWIKVFPKQISALSMEFDSNNRMVVNLDESMSLYFVIFE